MLLVIAVLSLATVYIMNNTGPAPWFAKVAEAFNGDYAYEHVEALAKMEGRGVGQNGGARAAAYIAEKFQAYGLQPGCKNGSYICSLEVQLVRPVAQPYLALMGADGNPLQSFRHQLDFGFVIQGHGGSGDVEAPLTFVGFQRSKKAYDWEDFKGLDLRDRIVVLLAGNAPQDFATEALIRGARGVLWIAGEGRDDVRSQIQRIDQTYLSKPSMPIFRIRPSAASAILVQDGISPSDLLQDSDVVGQSGPGWFTRDLSAVVRMSLTLGEPQTVEVPCALGYKPGSDFDLAGEMVILFAAYDGLGVDPDGTVFSAANHNASGVGILLEMARLWQEQNLNARRSVMFVAWGSGQLDDSGAKSFFSDPRNFPRLPSTDRIRPALIFQPDYAGTGGDTLVIDAHSSRQLSKLLEETAAELDIPVEIKSEGAQLYERIAPSRTSWVYFTWSDAGVAPDEDGIERIEADKLQMIGEVFALALIKVVRQARF
jgi:hypothetical protein